MDQGNIGGEDIATGTYTYYPSISVNSNLMQLIGFAASAPSIYPGAYQLEDILRTAELLIFTSSTEQGRLLYATIWLWQRNDGGTIHGHVSTHR